MSQHEEQMLHQARDFAARLFSDEQVKKIENHEMLLIGKDGNPGLAHKVGFMWKIHVWLLCGLSSIGGYSFCWVITKLTQHT